jgi:hypothetical protein
VMPCTEKEVSDLKDAASLDKTALAEERARAALQQHHLDQAQASVVRLTADVAQLQTLRFFGGVAPEVCYESIVKAGPSSCVAAGSLTDEQQMEDGWDDLPRWMAQTETFGF